MKAISLAELYASVNRHARKIYVVPLIRFTHKKTDYLYLLYQQLIKGDDFQINSISVFNHFKLVAGALSNKNAILHYHWLEFQDLKSLAGMPWKIMCIFLFKKLGGNIVWTLHNEFPHDAKFLKLHTFLHCKMAQWADALHVHCPSAIPLMSKRLDAPESKFYFIPHPEFPAEPIPPETAIQNINTRFNIKLNAEAPVLLMFGNISWYKQIEKVAEIVTGLPQNCTLLIVGPVKKGSMDLYRQLKKLEEGSPRIRMIPAFIKEEHVPWFYSAADICVFNYREILSSGGYHMGQAYDKTIIAPNKGCLAEEIHRNNVHLFNRQQELKELLEQQLKVLQNG